MTPPILCNGDAAGRPGTGRTQIIHSGAAWTATPTVQTSRHIGGSCVQPTGQAVTIGNEAPHPVLQASCPTGQSRLLSLDPRDAKQRYDVIGDLPPESPARARLWPGDKFVAQLSRAGTAETTAVVIERISGN